MVVNWFFDTDLFFLKQFKDSDFTFFIERNEYEQLKEFFFPTPQIPEDVYEQICKEASDFVWAMHRPWGHDDMFAEYMCLVNDMCVDKWNEMYSYE